MAVIGNGESVCVCCLCSPFSRIR